MVWSALVLYIGFNTHCRDTDDASVNFTRSLLSWWLVAIEGGLFCLTIADCVCLQSDHHGNCILIMCVLCACMCQCGCVFMCMHVYCVCVRMAMCVCLSVCLCKYVCVVDCNRGFACDVIIIFT